MNIETVAANLSNTIAGKEMLLATFLEEKRMLLAVMTQGDAALYAEASKYVMGE